MDWGNLIADVERIINKNFTPGRAGRKIDKIVVHHNAGTLSIDECYNVWQTRAASAHYQVERGGRIGQIVNDADTAWHAGDWEANLTSIGIEHANDSLSPNWTISEKTLDAGAHLVAAICHFYFLGRPNWGKNVFMHMDFSSTSCPGAVATKQHDAYIMRAQRWYDAMAGVASTPTKPEETTMTTETAQIVAVLQAILSKLESLDKKMTVCADAITPGQEGVKFEGVTFRQLEDIKARVSAAVVPEVVAEAARRGAIEGVDGKIANAVLNINEGRMQ